VISWSAGQHSKKILRETTTRESRDEFVLREKKKKTKKKKCFGLMLPTSQTEAGWTFSRLGAWVQKKFEHMFSPFQNFETRGQAFFNRGNDVKQVISI
jgi:hypothetical protein